MRISLICAAFLLSSPSAIAAVLVSDPLTETNTLQSLVREAVAAEKRVAIINNQISQLIQIKNTVAAVSHGNLAALSNLEVSGSVLIVLLFKPNGLFGKWS